MISEVILPAECFTANVAVVRSLVSVRSLVDEEVVTLGELSIAELANELFFGPLSGHASGDEGARWRWRSLDGRGQQPHVHLLHSWWWTPGWRATSSLLLLLLLSHDSGIADPLVQEGRVMLLLLLLVLVEGRWNWRPVRSGMHAADGLMVQAVAVLRMMMLVMRWCVRWGQRFHNTKRKRALEAQQLSARSKAHGAAPTYEVLNSREHFGAKTHRKLYSEEDEKKKKSKVNAGSRGALCTEDEYNYTTLAARAFERH